MLALQASGQVIFPQLWWSDLVFRPPAVWPKFVNVTVKLGWLPGDHFTEKRGGHAR
jgi:hypothetical protein